MKKTLIISILPLFLLLAGCGTWKKTKDLYKSYVNPSPKVSIDNEFDLSDPENRLAYTFVPVDERIEDLYRAISAQDAIPPDTWFKGMKEFFPWITGFTVITTQGEVLLKFPEEEVIKPLNFEPLLNAYKDGEDRQVRGYVDKTELGPEIYLAQPLYQNNVWHSMLVVYYDPRAVITFSPDKDNLVMLHPGGELWLPEWSRNSTAITATSWAKEAKSDARGRISADDGKYYWVSRPWGGTKLIYAIRVSK